MGVIVECFLLADWDLLLDLGGLEPRFSACECDSTGSVRASGSYWRSHLFCGGGGIWACHL